MSTSPTGLIAIQIGVMFAMLFTYLMVDSYLEDQQHQELIDIINQTDALKSDLISCQQAAKMCVAAVNHNGLEGGLWWYP